MKITTRQVEWLVVALFFGLVALVFQQAATNMAAQGIASGGPYDNAAAYPKIIAIGLGLLVAFQSGLQLLNRRRPASAAQQISLKALGRPAALIGIFALYLAALPILGYQIATPLTLGALMLVCGIRRPVAIVVPSLLISFGAAYLFEAWLKIVLPGGIFHLNMVW